MGLQRVRHELNVRAHTHTHTHTLTQLQQGRESESVSLIEIPAHETHSLGAVCSLLTPHQAHSSCHACAPWWGGVGALYSVTVSTSLVSNVLSLEHSGWLHPFLLGNWLGLCNLLLGMITQYCSPSFHLEYHLSMFLTLLLLLNMASSGLWEPDCLCHLLFKTLPSLGVQGPGLCMMGYAFSASVPSAVSCSFYEGLADFLAV